MKLKLTEKDRKILKYSTRTGYVFGAFILIPSVLAYILAKIDIVEISPDYLFLFGILVCVLIVWLVNRKWWIDLRNNEKEVVKKIIDKKELKEEYAAGSSVGFSTTGTKSTFYTGQKSYTDYSLIIENVRYKVDKEVWESVNEKEEIEFHFAPKSKYLLDIKPISGHRKPFG